MPAFASTLFAVLFAVPLLAAQPPNPVKPELPVLSAEVAEIAAPANLTLNAPAPSLLPMALGNSLVDEIEPNNSPASAMPLQGTAVRLRGNTFPANDLDYFRFEGSAGDRVYAATMTLLSPGSTDSTLTLFDTDGTTIIEVDVNDGSFSATSSSIAGAVLPASGTYYLQVRSTTPTATIRPYDLYFQLRSGSPTAENEPNDLGGGGQPLPVSGWVSGAVNPAGDNDVFTLALNAGDTVFLSLDLDPERDAVAWNGRLGFGAFSGSIAVVNDANTVSPNSEAFFFTVKEAGSYLIYVDPSAAGTGDPSFTYHLSATVFPAAPATGSCATYSSVDVPVIVPDGPSLVSSTLIVPGNPRIADLDVSIQLSHANMPDLDLVLQAPGGNQVVLFSDVGSNTQPNMDLRLDDEAAIPIGFYTLMSGMAYQPEPATRLSWFDGQDAGGVWTLRVYDDAAANGGTLSAWSLTICEPPPPPTCPVGTQPVTVFETDFNADDAGFTASGTQVEWAWGTPTAAPIDSCASGSTCWVTDLTGTYNASSNQTLLSPAIDLSGLVGPITMHWAQKHQIESASFDNASVVVQEAGGANPSILWEWLDATMTQAVGNPNVTIQQSAGWAHRSADISAYAGQSIEAAFRLSSDTTVQLAGLAIDDVVVTACEPLPPSISLTLGVAQGPVDDLNPICSTDSAITVPVGAEVEYCYTVTNTGGVSLTRHDLVDSELGTVLSNLAYSLDPGASAFLTQSATPDSTVTHTATWTAYNPGPTDLATAIDQATITVDPDTVSFCNVGGIAIPGSGSATPYPSTIDVSGMGSSLADLRVRLNRLYHTWPDDIDVLLVGPEGQNLILMSDAGGSSDIANAVLVFDDAAAGPLPDNSQIVSGSYQPTNYEVGDSFPAPAPVPSAETQLAAFNGSNPNGTWALYVVDDIAGDLGSIELGWCLEVNAPLQPPAIDVSPMLLDANQPANATTTQILTVSNAGEADLHWQVAGAAARPAARPEAPPGPRPVDPALAADRVDAAQPAGIAPPSIARWPAASPQGVVPPLYDNGPIVTHPGGGAGGNDASALQTSLGLTVFGFGHAAATGFRVADDFTVPASGWWIDQIEFFAYQTGSGSGSTITAVNLRIWDGPPSDPGSSIVFGDTTTNRLSNSQWTGIYRASETDLTSSTRPIMINRVEVGVFLPAGDYWLDWQTDGSLASGPWAPPVSILGQTTTGNAMQFNSGSASWVPLLDTGLADAQQDLPFLIYGLDDCANPSELSWLNVGPASGTLSQGQEQEVTVGFDSTGLTPGSYDAKLCVASNDPDSGPGAGTNLVEVPVSLTVQATPSIELAVTVGTTDGVCAATSSLLVDAGTTVYFCYAVTNTGDVTLNLHDLVDDQIGLIYSGLNYALTPGSSVDTVTAGLSIPAVINASVTNTATWTGYNAGPTNVATAQASATVTLAQPSITLVKTVGTNPGVCAATSAIAVPPGTEVTYCYTVTNTGNVTLNLHDLEDDQLGTIFAGFNYALAPGASAFILETATVNDSVVNTATWDAYNPGPVNVASGQDSATVVVSDLIFADGFEDEP